MSIEDFLTGPACQKCQAQKRVGKTTTTAGFTAYLCCDCASDLEEMLHENWLQYCLIDTEGKAWEAALQGADTDKLNVGIDALRKLAMQVAVLHKESRSLCREWLSQTKPASA